MSVLLSFYRARSRFALARYFQYRAEVLVWLIYRVLEPVIFLAVWTTVVRSAEEGQVAGYTLSDFVAYFSILMVVSNATYTWVFWDFEFRIRNGSLAQELLRPIHPVHTDLAENLAYKALTLLVILPIVVALMLGFRAELHPPLLGVVLFIPVLALAFALRFVIEWTLALAAFWTTRVSAVNNAYSLALLFLSGQIAPLSLFPAVIQTLNMFLPFRWMIAFPVELLLGRLSLLSALIGIAAQFCWVLASVAFLGIIWRAGARRFSAVGL